MLFYALVCVVCNPELSPNGEKLLLSSVNSEKFFKDVGLLLKRPPNPIPFILNFLVPEFNENHLEKTQLFLIMNQVITGPKQHFSLVEIWTGFSPFSSQDFWKSAVLNAVITYHRSNLHFILTEPRYFSRVLVFYTIAMFCFAVYIYLHLNLHIYI